MTDSTHTPGPSRDDLPPYLTVVFKIADRTAFDAFYESTLKPLIKFGAAGNPYQVVGWAVDDELYRSQLFYEAMERYRTYDKVAEAMEAIFQCPELREWDWDKWDANESKAALSSAGGGK